VLGHRRLTIFVSVLIVMALAAGLARLDVSNNYRVFFSDENPDLVAFNTFEKTYTKNDNFLFAFKPETGTIDDPRFLGVIEDFTKRAWSTPYAIRVDSLTNFQHTYAIDDDLIVEDLIINAAVMSEDEVRSRVDIALAEPLLNGRLVAGDRGATGINVTLQYPEESLAEVPEAMDFARDLVAEFEAAYPDVEIAITGVSAVNAAFAEATVNDAMTLFGPMFLVLVFITWLIVRSVSGTVATVFVITLATLAAMGLAAWVGITISPFSGAAPVVILTLAIADSIHILITLVQRMRAGDDKNTALRESLRVNFLAVSITSLTTIIGFLALNFSDAPPFNALGNISAAGIAAAWLLSLTFFPALLSLLPLTVKQSEAGQAGLLQGTVNRIANFVIARTRLTLAASGIVLVGLAAAIPLVDLNDQWVEYFDHRIEIRPDTEFALDHLTGLYVVEYSVPAGGEGAVSEPGYLRDLEDFAVWLRARPDVRHVFSYTDIIKRLNRNLNGDDPAFYRLPENRELAAQYLMLYELSLPYGLDMNDRIDINKSSSRVTVTLGDVTTRDTRDFLADVEAWWDTRDAAKEEYATGATYLFSFISERNIRDMIGGNIIAVLIIAAIMMVALRSIGFGILSLLPNLAPLVMTFGIWALLVGEVGMAAATVSATSLGIIVDNTVHILTKYRRARRESGLNVEGAVRYAFDTVGAAVAANALILALGFSVLAYSSFKITAEMGLLTALAIVIALLVDLFLLPALLLLGAQPQTKGKTIMQYARTNGRLLSILAGAALLGVGATAAVADNLQRETGVVVAAVETVAEVEAIAFSSDPAVKGHQIAALADRSDRGFRDSRVELEMILRNAGGSESKRKLKISTLEVPDESVGDKGLIVFSIPRDIKGTALLSHAKILEPDNQWLYLPALKRVKRISSRNKSGPFVGSEFAFEDITGQELDKYNYVWLREEACGAFVCDVIERRPRYENSGYTRQIVWVDQTHRQPRKLEYYDRKDALLKTQTFEDYRLYNGEYWRAQTFRMDNHQTGKSTDLIFGDYTFGIGLKDKNFVKNVLSRAR